MVRLKVRLKMPLTTHTFLISIPYGSIKSPFLAYKKIVFDISIPYGSIKRERALPSSAQTKLFQFLMVRLKVERGGIVPGTSYTFQFLMVRLKGRQH